MVTGPKRSGLLATLMTLPPALTVFAGLSTLLTFGAAGEWLQTYWFPITRALWGHVFDLIDWAPPTAWVDYLTAIIFFAPAAFWPPTAEPQAIRTRVLAFPLALITVWILARSSISDGWAFLGQSIQAFGDAMMWLLYPISYLCVLIIPLLILEDAKALLASSGARLRDADLHPPLTRMRLGLQGLNTLICITAPFAFLALDIFQTYQNGWGFDLSARRLEIFMAPHPVRTLVAFGVILMFYHMVSGLIRRGHVVTKDPSTMPKQQTKAAERAEDQDTGADITIYTYIALGGLGVALGAWRFGLALSIMLAVLFGLIIATSLKAPVRMIRIAQVVLILITGAYAIDLIAYLRQAAESLA